MVLPRFNMSSMPSLLVTPLTLAVVLPSRTGKRLPVT